MHRQLAGHKAVPWGSVKCAVPAIVLWGGALPLALGVCVHWFVPREPLFNPALHGAVEMACACALVALASLIILVRQHDHTSVYPAPVASGLLFAGSFDILHACAGPRSDLFVWLHCLGVAGGGVMVAAVWLREPWPGRFPAGTLPRAAVASALLAGLLSALFSNGLPGMTREGHFTIAADVLHLVGFVGFVLAGAWFAGQYRKTHRVDEFFLCIFFLLFADSALLFSASTLWSPDWWLWHAVRLAACGFGAWYVFRRIGKVLDDQVSARAEAEEASRAKSRFFAATTHELRTPLNSILGFSELLTESEDLPREDVRGFAGRIHQSGADLLLLINDILDITRLEAGGMTVNIQRVVLEDAVNSSIRGLQGDVEKKKVRIRKQMADSLVVMADPSRLCQVLSILLSNAVKSSPPEGEVRIEAECRDDLLLLSVTDQGAEIPEDVRAHIFEPFSHPSRSGLGMAITRQLVHAQGGRLTVESRPGSCNRFTLSLQHPAQAGKGAETGGVSDVCPPRIHPRAPEPSGARD